MLDDLKNYRFYNALPIFRDRENYELSLEINSIQTAGFRATFKNTSAFRNGCKGGSAHEPFLVVDFVWATSAKNTSLAKKMFCVVVYVPNEKNQCLEFSTTLVIMSKYFVIDTLNYYS